MSFFHGNLLLFAKKPFSKKTVMICFGKRWKTFENLKTFTVDVPFSRIKKIEIFCDKIEIAIGTIKDFVQIILKLN